MFKFGVVTVNGKWAIGEHAYDSNGLHYVKPIMSGYESQIAAYCTYQDWINICPVGRI